MIKIGILGDIGSGKSYIAQRFGYPVFDADREVAKLYQQNRNIFTKLKKKLPKQVVKNLIIHGALNGIFLSTRGN